MGTSLKAYIFDVEDNTGPRAVITPVQQQTVVGAVAKLDGRASFDTATNPSGILNYTWTFSRFPIGSQVELEGFASLDPDEAVVSFAPDITGLYEIQLIVDDGSIDSPAFIAAVDVSITIVPNNQGIIPDASFLWNYLSDFWSLVADKGKFEVVWSAAIQIVAAELLKLYQYDYNKSIKDIQELIQKRWVDYKPALELDPLQVTGTLADDQAGLAAATLVIDPNTGIILGSQPDFFNLVSIPLDEGSFVTTPDNIAIATGRLITLADQTFTMARSSDSVKAVNEGVDGVTALGSDLFKGSGFLPVHVGQIFRIGGIGADAKRYLIGAVDNETDLRLTDFSNPPVTTSFLATASNLEYSIIPIANNISNFFSDVKEIPTKAIGLPWRFSPTIVTTEFDLELQGVSVGDVLEIEVKRVDLNLTAVLQCQVVGTDRGSLSFVFNLDNLVEGTAASGLSETAQLALAEALQVTGLERDVNGVLQYTLEADLVHKIVTSVAFKRLYFETDLTFKTVLDLKAFTIKLRPLRVRRNSKVLINEDVRSIPVLQEYIRQPDLATLDGMMQVVSRSGKLFPIDHTPYVLAENLDYIIDNEATIIGAANTTQNLNEIEIPRGDLIDRSVAPGDILELLIGSTTQAFTIRKVLTPELVRVFPTPSSTESGIQFVLKRKVAGRYIRFVEGCFTKTNPTPLRLWAELTYFSNDPNIEANFGVLVGVKKKELDTIFVSASYKSVVEGLMFALTNGPIHENLRLSAQILLGLPFAAQPGVITEINPSWRIRENGSPLFGRVLLEVRDSDNNPTGVTNIYLIPQGRQLEDPDDATKWIPATPNESGIAANPATGVDYIVGDTVDQFSVLSRGVSIEDYLSDPASTQVFVEQGDLSALLTQYHTFRLTINVDVTTPADIDVATSFIKKAKPAHVRILAGLSKVIEDFVVIKDALIFGRELEFFENISLSLPIAVKADQGSGDDDFLSAEGVMYTRYMIGTDLVTTQGSNSISSASGGFITAPAGQSYDSPFARTGDLIIIVGGSNAGRYDVLTVDSDVAVTVVNGGTFETLTGQTFRLFRPVNNRIFQGMFVVAVGNPVVSAPVGMFSAGVAVGDIFTFHGGVLDGSQRYPIIRVDSVLQELEVTPAPIEASGRYTGNIRRSGLEERYFGELSTAQPHSAGWTSGSNSVVFVSGSSDLDLLSFLRPGDELEADSLPDVQHLVLDFDPVTLTAFVLPAPSFTAAADPTRASRPDRPSVPISMDHLDQIPRDSLLLEQRLPSGTQDLVTTAALKDVTTVSLEDFAALGILPGDFLVILEGGDSNRDIGYGNGVFPIQELVSSTVLRLTRALTVTNPSPGIEYGFQKRETYER